MSFNQGSIPNELEVETFLKLKRKLSSKAYQFHIITIGYFDRQARLAQSVERGTFNPTQFPPRMIRYFGLNKLTNTTGVNTTGIVRRGLNRTPKTQIDRVNVKNDLKKKSSGRGFKSLIGWKCFLLSPADFVCQSLIFKNLLLIFI